MEQLNDLMIAEQHCQSALRENRFGGVVYCYANRKNDKRYVGQTIWPKRRHQQHMSALENSGFHEAIRSEGKEAFGYTILGMYIADSREELSDILDEEERKYILQYNTLITQKGYNVSDGGTKYSGSNDYSSKPVDMYSLSGKFIRTFESISHANQFIGMTGSSIRSACNHVGNVAAGYLWAWKGEDVVIPEDKSIGCYNLNGDLVCAYPNAFQASKALGGVVGGIYLAIKDKYRIAYGFYWRDYVADMIPITDFPKAFFTYTPEGKFLRGYRTLKEAIRGVNASGSSAICAASTKNKFYRGLLWRKYFVEQLPYDEIPYSGRPIKVKFPDGTVKIYRQILHAALDNGWEISGLKAALQGKGSSISNIVKVSYFNEIVNPNIHPNWIYVNAADVADKKLVKPGKLLCPVDQYDKNGKYIASFDSVADAERITGITSIKTAIYNANCCGGYIWTQKGEPINQKTLDFIDSLKVYQYDSEGSFVREFAAKEDAAIAIGYASSNSHIGRCTREPWRQAKGYYWRTFKQDKIKLYKNKTEWLKDSSHQTIL